MISNRHIVNSAEEMKNLASQLANVTKKGDVFALQGNLGSGKTTFAQGFILALQSQEMQALEPVTSPTFNLIQIYKTIKDFNIYHCDFYRLKHESEIYNLGIEEAFKSDVTLIEWPEIAHHLLPKNTKFIEITINENLSRKVEIKNLPT